MGQNLISEAGFDAWFSFSGDTLESAMIFSIKQDIEQ